MAIAAITFTAILWHRLVIIDVVVFAVLVAIQSLSLFPAGTETNEDIAQRSAASSAVGSASGAGIAAVGILIPLTLLAVQRAVDQKPALRGRITQDLFVAECWFAFSLALGLLVLWFVAFKAATRNVTRTPHISLIFSLQLFALFFGIVRVLIATFNLIGA